MPISLSFDLTVITTVDNTNIEATAIIKNNIKLINNFISVIESMLDRNLLEAYFINYFPYYINFGQIFLICFFSFLISLISSLIPSLRAVRLNPVEILRHE